MPLFGTLDLESALATAPTVSSLVPEPLTLPAAQVLQVSYEVAEAPAMAITPPGLHPSIPPYATFTVWNVPDSSVGPFRFAMVRLIVRAGIRPRGLLVKAFADSDAAVDRLRSGWGYDVSVAEVALHRRHNRITGSVSLDGATALEVALDDPQPVAGSDLELFDNLHLVNVDDGDPLIVQVDPGYEYHNADRGLPRLERFEADALGAGGIEPVYGVVAVACTADVALAAPRFVIDPTKPAVQGTRRLESSAN